MDSGFVDASAGPARVEIAAGGHQVVVEAQEPLATVARQAVELWQATDSAAVVRGAGAAGFHTELQVLLDDAVPDRSGEGGVR